MPKLFEFKEVQSDDIPSSVYHIWQFIDKHPECKDMDEEELQGVEGMWFRKVAIAQALDYGRPKTDPMPNTYPTEEQAVAEVQDILQKQKKYRLEELLQVNLQVLQNNVVGLVYRKRITRQALKNLQCLLK